MIGLIMHFGQSIASLNAIARRHPSKKHRNI